MNWKTVVRIKFTDNTSVIRNLTDSQMYEMGIFNDDALSSYFENLFDCNTVSSYNFVKKSNYQFDVRDYVSDRIDLCGENYEGKEIEEIEFLPENSYEYNIAALEMDSPGNLYLRCVDLDIEEPADYDYYWDEREDPYSDDPPSD